jgi:hypothetical protein
MKERLIQISEELPNNITCRDDDLPRPTPPKPRGVVNQNGEAVSTENNDLADFLSAMEASAPKIPHSPLFERGLSPQSLKRIGTFHSIFLKILKEDIDKLGMNYNKNF